MIRRNPNDDLPAIHSDAFVDSTAIICGNHHWRTDCHGRGGSHPSTQRKTDRLSITHPACGTGWCLTQKGHSQRFSPPETHQNGE